MTRFKSGVKSRVTIFGHPVHPILVPFPIAFLVGLLFSNIVFAVTRVPFWAYMSKWLATAGVLTAGLSAIVGIIELAAIERVRSLADGWIHGIGNAFALTFSLINMILLWQNTLGYVFPASLVLSAITAVILLVTGWYGGELTYRYGVGVLISESTESREQEEPPYKKRAA